MVTITRSVVFLSAVVAAAVGVASHTSGLPVEPSATAQVEERFPLTSEIFTPVPITFYIAQKFNAAQKAAAQKARRQPISGSCASTPNGWPYVSQACLVAADRTDVPTWS